MQELNLPPIGSEIQLTLKEPFYSYINNILNRDSSSVKFTISSTTTLQDFVTHDLNDAFTTIYQPVGLTTEEYLADLEANVYIVGIYVKIGILDAYFRVPVSYITSFSSIGSIRYVGKKISINLGLVYENLDIEMHLNDIADFIESRLGITPTITIEETDSSELVDDATHQNRETLRTNSITVNKTLYTQLEELNLKYTDIVNRLHTLGIVLG